MRDLTPREASPVAATRTGTPPRDYGLDARLEFWLENIVFGKARTLSKFRARELIARSL